MSSVVHLKFFAGHYDVYGWLVK